MVRGRSGAPSRGRRVALIAAILAFAIVDVALITIAVRAGRTAPESSEVYQIPTPDPIATGRATSAPIPTPTRSPEAVAPRRFITALDASTAWRASGAPCPSSLGGPELTTDGGGTWTAAPAEGTGASQVLQLDVLSPSHVSMVTLGADDCAQAQVTATYTAGDDWEAYTDDRLQEAWYIEPGNAAVAHSPGGDVSLPCTGIALAYRSSDEAAVVCKEETTIVTTDAGETWAGSFALAGGSAIDDTADGYVVATIDQPGCDGVGVITITSTTDPVEVVPTGCFAASTSPGEVAIAFAPDSLWVWADTALGVSTDGGATWQ